MNGKSGFVWLFVELANNRQWHDDLTFLSVKWRRVFSSTANPIIISNRAPEDHMQAFCLCQARCVRVCSACRLENIMALPWSYGDMGLKSLNSLFLVFYLWLVSGKWEPIVQVLYVVESKSLFVWFCAFVNLQCNYWSMNISAPFPKILHNWLGKSLFGHPSSVW